MLYKKDFIILLTLLTVGIFFLIFNGSKVNQNVDNIEGILLNDQANFAEKILNDNSKLLKSDKDENDKEYLDTEDYAHEEYKINDILDNNNDFENDDNNENNVDDNNNGNIVDDDNNNENNAEEILYDSPIDENKKYNETECIVNYQGGELEPEWEWVKDISIVYTWVDGNDVDFLDIKSKYNGGIREYNSRDRSADELRYSFRSLKKYLPWHRGTIYIVTNDQIPKWLDTSNPRVKIIYHRDIFPEHVFPTYDSTTIELYFDKIPGITERFIYFNDDIFLNNYVHPAFFFTSKTFYPKVYRRHIADLEKSKIDEIIRLNMIHEIFQATKYYTREIIRKYFDKEFKYRDLYHTGHVFYRDLYEPYRQLFKDELKIVCSDRFRSPYKPQVIYLYQTFVQYVTKHKEFPKKFGGKGKAKSFKGYTLPANRTINDYSVKIVSGPIADKFIKFGKITDDSRRNRRYFNLYKTHTNLLIYNFNDAYTKEKSLYEFTEYMVTRYPDPSEFEKEEYIEVEKEIMPIFNKTNSFSNNITDSVGSLFKEQSIYKFKQIVYQYKLNIISDYLDKKEAISGPKKEISDRESSEVDFLLSYNGKSLSDEWQWAKDISFVYILKNAEPNNNNVINELKYSMRSIDMYLPWFKGNIFIVTQREVDSELSWIKSSNQRVKIIHQSEILPESAADSENIHAIEMYLDKIPGISERFVYLANNHYFINYVHPRFFFSKKFYPKYNLHDVIPEDELDYERSKHEDFFNTYSVIMSYFGEYFITTYRYFRNAPFPFYRDLFKPVRVLYKNYVDEILGHKYSETTDILPLYLVSTYNIYGTEQPYFPDYVTGYGKVKKAPLPRLNPDRTIDFYGFEVTSPYIANNTMITDVTYGNNVTSNNEFINEIQQSNKLFFSLEIEDIEDAHSGSLEDLKNLMNILFNKRSSFEL
ncbi:hypothetical protein BCR36DRAFT_581246 [Piromyces finnis]|uniref:Stealth protein CR2 conserved region 2 domain-containing protein n=1 Tax=Piromyces finnis TaxID=1754191 RepID=A0A1Y1VJ31_9FUNG|nr:hypothetical protein BCR36DRAFT_581246 [Piromyces finnis]|eukprot:ORX56102.1 hypothetical protein BCR36DRAFT_581246 [Piromyces finnis]